MQERLINPQVMPLHRSENHPLERVSGVESKILPRLEERRNLANFR